MPVMTMNAARSTLPPSPSAAAAAAAAAAASTTSSTSTSRAYQPHRPGYHWEPAKKPPAAENVDDDDEEDDFLQRIVHGSCQGVPGCQGENALTCHMAEQLDLDLLMHCRQPLAFLSIFQEHRGGDRGGGDIVLPPGAYTMHTTGCEYCGAPDTHRCDADERCRRPALFFQKKRPPFAPADPALWDPVTEHAVVEQQQRTASSTPRPASPFEGSWVSGLFRKGRNEPTMDGSTR